MCSEALDFLNGNYEPILKDLQEKMQDASENLEFEKAIEYRELLEQREAGGPEAENHQTATGRTRTSSRMDAG